jgi:hypothetical protein
LNIHSRQKQASISILGRTHRLGAFVGCYESSIVAEGPVLHRALQQVLAGLENIEA